MIGHTIGVYGLAMHKDGTVQVEPLTWIMVADCDWTNAKHKRWFYRFVSALDQALKDLEKYYAVPPLNPSESYEYTLQSPLQDRPTKKKAKLSVECWFPYPRSYTHLTTGGRITFTFERRLFQGRLLFTAMESESQKRILVKFVLKTS